MNVRSACPNCGDEVNRETYDIGSGPELSCASCEWCWGALGQPLKPLDFRLAGEPPFDTSLLPPPFIPTQEHR